MGRAAGAALIAVVLTGCGSGPSAIDQLVDGDLQSFADYCAGKSPPLSNSVQKGEFDLVMEARSDPNHAYDDGKGSTKMRDRLIHEADKLDAIRCLRDVAHRLRDAANGLKIG